jgi:hypothetical protein
MDDIVSIIKESYMGETGIIYCISKNRCEDVARFLQGEGIRACPYHAGLTSEERQRNQNDWSNDKVMILPSASFRVQSFSTTWPILSPHHHFLGYFCLTPLHFFSISSVALARVNPLELLPPQDSLALIIRD